MDDIKKVWYVTVDGNVIEGYSWPVVNEDGTPTILGLEEGFWFEEEPWKN